MEEVRQVLGDQGVDWIYSWRRIFVEDAEFYRESVKVERVGLTCCQGLVWMRTLAPDLWTESVQDFAGYQKGIHCSSPDGWG